VGFAHRRLSIIDLSPSGHQPMHDVTGSLCIVFNGEIYNHSDLREELVAKGHFFPLTFRYRGYFSCLSRMGNSMPDSF